jgi:hypothetical protein
MTGLYNMLTSLKSAVIPIIQNAKIPLGFGEFVKMQTLELKSQRF